MGEAAIFLEMSVDEESCYSTCNSQSEAISEGDSNIDSDSSIEEIIFGQHTLIASHCSCLPVSLGYKIEQILKKSVMHFAIFADDLINLILHETNRLWL